VWVCLFLVLWRRLALFIGLSELERRHFPLLPYNSHAFYRTFSSFLAFCLIISIWASKPSEKPDADASSADTTKTDNPDVMANNNNSSAAATSSTGGGQVMPTGKTRVHEEDGKAKAKPVAAWQRTSPRCHCCF
jgi:hypothetical protein